MSDLTAAVSSIKYRSIVSVGEQYRQLNLKPDWVGPAVGAAMRLSPTKGLRLAKGILKTSTSRYQAIDESNRLIAWAGEAGSNERQLITKTLQANKGSVLVVHHISELPRQRAQEYMIDYFAARGDMGAVARWLQLTGGVLRKHRVKAPNTAGILIDVGEWVIDKVEDTVDTAVEAVETIVDAVIAAEKTLVDIAAEVITWTVDQVADLVSALLEAGTKVGEILTAALVSGIEDVKKFVKAIVKAVDAVADVMAWAAQQTLTVMGDVLRALRDAAVRVGKVLQWAAGQVADFANRVVQGLIDIGQSVAQILTAAAEMAFSVIKATISALMAIGRTIGEIVVTAFTRPWDLVNATVRALLELGHTMSDLFKEVIGAVADGVRKMTRALIQIGKSVASLVAWAADQAIEIVRDVMRGILEAGKSLVDLMASVTARALSVVRKFVQAAFDLGRTLTQLIKELFTLTVDALSKILRAAFELGKTVLEFVAHTISRTYRAAAKLIDAALRAGVAVAELLHEVAGKTYWALRKMINGILKALGPVGDVLDWVFDQASGIADSLWHKALLAVRYAHGKLSDALDWAAQKGEQALEAIVRAWESIGETLLKVYEWAKNVALKAGDAVWVLIGKVTVKLENSISYGLLYLEKDFIPGIQKYIKGVLDAGAEVADLIILTAKSSYAAVAEVIHALFDYGATMADLLVGTIKHPDGAFKNVLKAAEEAGKTMKNIFQAAIIDTGGQFLKRVTLTLKNLGKPIKDMLNAVAEISFGAVANEIDILLNTLASYRPLTAQEKADARRIYADSIDLDKIYVSVEDLTNEVIFDLQDWLRSTPDSRAFTTNTLINFDVHDPDGINRFTLIHELCHVWQALVTGPFYLVEALHAVIGNDYNYGWKVNLGSIPVVYDYDGHVKQYDKGWITGEGAQQVLRDTHGNFDAFNREQQARIIEHYFVRRYLLNYPPQDYADWQKYVDVVQAG